MSMTQPGQRGSDPQGGARRGARRAARRHRARRGRPRGARAPCRPRRRAAAAALRRGRRAGARRSRSSRSAATAGGISACTRTSICWCCSAAASGRRRSGSCAASCIRSGISASSSATRCASSTSSPTLETDNPEFLLALLDARLVAGAAHAVRAARRRCSTGRRRTPTSCRSLLQLIEERHAQFNARSISSSPTSRRRPARCAI